MLAWEDSRLPQDVEDLARRVDRWRRKRVGRARMPETLWAEALEVAAEWGPYQAAQVREFPASVLGSARGLLVAS